MKKKISLLLCCLIFVFLSSCSENEVKLPFDKEARMKKIQSIILDKALKENNLEVSKEELNYVKEDDEYEYTAYIERGSNSVIEVFVLVQDNVHNEDISRFSVSINNEKCQKNAILNYADLELFCDLVNSISYKSISESQVKTFLSNDKYIYSEHDDGAIYKNQSLDFFDTYFFEYSYEPANSGYEEFSFCGNKFKSVD